ncbi:hypothetical protein OsJ_07477 [Oryza sativa Japonica Group]|uniref:Uncharacterized protein n=1 Tax=Oryza sativa subsp. japonica TaxID=39947 RepID=B9F106_ORYSJ|nr:hypothetical protein OsJ_07477 [Oryza sativa Japonica Group]
MLALNHFIVKREADEGTCYDVMFCRGDVCKLRCRYLGYPDNAPCYCKSKPDGAPSASERGKHEAAAAAGTNRGRRRRATSGPQSAAAGIIVAAAGSRRHLHRCCRARSRHRRRLARVRSPLRCRLPPHALGAVAAAVTAAIASRLAARGETSSPPPSSRFGWRLRPDSRAGGHIRGPPHRRRPRPRPSAPLSAATAALRAVAGRDCRRPPRPGSSSSRASAAPAASLCTVNLHARIGIGLVWEKKGEEGGGTRD